MMSLMAVQRWPLYEVAPSVHWAAARSRSASGSTMPRFFASSCAKTCGCARANVTCVNAWVVQEYWLAVACMAHENARLEPHLEPVRPRVGLDERVGSINAADEAEDVDEAALSSK